MAMTFHPDKNNDPSAADRFKEVSLAYEVLSDADRREMYDVAGEASLHEGFDPSFFLGRYVHRVCVSMIAKCVWSVSLVCVMCCAV